MEMKKDVKVKIYVPVVFLFLLLMVSRATSLQLYWTGAVDNLWSTASNWSPSIVPTINDTANFNSTANNCNLIGDVYLMSLIFTPGYTGVFTQDNHKLIISGDLDFSKGGPFTFNAGDTLFCTSGSMQRIIGKPGETLPVIVKDGSGTLEVFTVGFKVFGLIFRDGIISNSMALNDTVIGDFICTGGELRLNSGSIVLNGNVDLSGIQNFTDNSGIIYINGVVNQNLIPKSGVLLPAIHKISNYNLTINDAHFRSRSLKIMNGQVSINNSYNIDSINVSSGATFQSSMTLAWKDTISYLDGNGNFYISNDELCFTGNILNCSSLSAFNAGPSGALSFIGNNQTFIPKSFCNIPRLRQCGSGTTTVSTNGFIADTLEIVSGEFNLGSGLIDSVSRAVKMLGGTLNFGSSTLGVGADTLNLNGAGTIIPGTGYLNYNKYSNRVFIPRSDGVYPKINISGMTTYIRGNHFKAPNVNLSNGTIEMDTTFSIDTINMGSGSIFRCSNTTGTRDTVQILMGTGSVELNNSELCFNSPQVDLSMSPSITGGAISFIGTNQTFTPSMSFTYNKIRQYGTGITTVITNGLRVDTLEIISGEFNLGNGLNDSVSRAVRMLGGILNFGNSTLGVGADTLNLNGAGTIIPGNGHLNLGGYSNRVFIPRSDGVHPRISISGMTTYVRGNHFRAQNVNLYGGTIEMDTTFTIDTLNVGSGSILRCNSAAGTSDTVKLLMGNGAVELRSSELCFKGPQVDLSMGTSIMGGAITFIGTNQTFTPSMSLTYNKIRRKGTGITTVITNGLRVDTLEIISGEFNLGNGLVDSVRSAVKMLGGTLNFGGSVLRYGSVNLDMTGSGTIIPSNGTIDFSGMITQYFTPSVSGLMPRISSSSDQLHIKGNRLRTNKLSIHSGSVVMDTIMNVDTLVINFGSTFSFDTIGNQKDSIGVISGNGNLQFGKSILHVSRNADFGYFTQVTGMADIEFGSEINCIFRPNSNFVFNKIKKYGSATLTIDVDGLRTNHLIINSGTLDMGTSVNDTIYDTLILKNASMNLGNNPVAFKSLIDSNSSINFNNGSLVRLGGSGIVDLAAAQNFLWNNEGFTFDGLMGSKTTLIPPSACQLAPIKMNGNDTIVVRGNINGSAIVQNNGNWNWGNGLNHTVNSIEVNSGSMSFGSAVVTVDQGNLFLQHATAIQKDSGTIIMSGKSGYQTITSPTAYVLPKILKTDTAILMIQNTNLKCFSFRQTAGKTWFSGFGIEADSSIVFENVDSLIHMDGITLQAGQSIKFSGTAENLLYCNPMSQWYINVPGELKADFAVIGNSSVSGTTGTAYGPSIDYGGNTNWLFRNDTFPPDNDISLQLLALDTGRVRISWNPLVVDSLDAEEIGIWYSNVRMPESINDDSASLLGYYSLNDSVDTVINLGAHTTFYFALAVSDTEGNWSDFTSNSSKIVRTRTISPQLLSAPDTIHSISFPLSWKNPPGLTTQDLLYLHITEVGNPSSKIFAAFSSSTTSATVQLPPKEAVYKYMLSSSHDSAGLYNVNDTYIDSVRFTIDPPILTISKDTFNNYYPVINWNAPYGFSASNTFYVYTDTINGAGYWVLKGQYPGSVTSHQCAFTNYGAYKIMVSTNWDINGKINPDNVALDTLYLIPSTSVYSWDVSPDTGYQITAGNWGSSRFWSIDGRSLTAWPGAGNSARFSGSVANALVIVVSGTQNADSIIFDTRGITLSGGALNLASGVIRGNAIDTIFSSMYSKNISKTGSGEIVTNGMIQCDTLKINSGILTISRSDTGSTMLPRVLSVNNSTRLNGNGRIAAKVIANSSSVLSPGGVTAQSVSMDDLSMAPGCSLNIDIGSQFDTVNVKNRVTLAGFINIQNASGFGKGAYPIIRCTGTIIDSGVQISKTPTPLYRYSLRTENSAVVLYIDSVITDATPPKVSIRLTSGSLMTTVPANISGTAYDSISGILSISILVSKNKDTTYWNGTTWQKSIFWIPLQKQSEWIYSTAGITCSDGKYVIKVGATDSIGNISYDTTFFFVDATAPVITKIFDNLDSIGSWTGLISGEALDSFSIIKQIRVSVKNDSGKFYDGTTWSTQEYFHICDGTSTWSKLINKQFLVDGNYTVSVISSDTVGNISKPEMKYYKYMSKKEQYRANLSSVAMNCSTAVYSWQKQNPAIFDSIQLVLSKTSIPMSLQDGEYRYIRSNNDSTVVINGLPDDGFKIFSRIFYKQYSGGYLSNYDSTGNILQLPDCIAPQNLVRVVLSNIGDTVISAAIKSENTEAVKILVGIGLSKENAKLSAKEISSNDTLVNTHTTVPGIFYLATASRDLSGNVSTFKLDSILINNSIPKINNLSDTTVVEGKTFTRQILASDVNNDSFDLKLIQLKSGMDLNRTIFRWTPKNSDVGMTTVVIECRDSRGASVYDTFVVNVKNVPEPPIISFEGSFEVYEDSNYNGSIKIVDPDYSDTSKVSINKMPAWMKLTQNTLNGRPQNEDVGIHSVELIFQDKDSLLDTLAFQVKVININDVPALISGTVQDTMTEKQKYTTELKIADQDVNDSLYVKNISGKSWVKVYPAIKSTINGEWQSSMSFSPLQADTGLHEIKFEIADKSGATIYYTKKIKVLDADDPPGKPLLVRKIASGAVQYTVNASDDRDKLLTYSVKLRSLKNDTILYSDSSVKVMYTMYPLTDGRYEFKAVAIDNSGLKSGVATDTLTIQGASEYIIKDTGWGMVSIPSKKYNIADLKNSDYVLYWDESGVEKQVYSFYKTKAELSEIEPSKAYWRKGSLPDTIRLTTSEFVKEPVSIKLHKNSSGWNQISSPFPYPVTWSRKNDILWKWNSKTNDYEEVQTILEPWSGYWVRVDTTAEAVLSPVPALSSGSLLKLRKTYFQSKTNWVMQVSLKSGAGNDADNKFGFNQNALDQFDEFDRPEPPAIEGRPVLFFSHNDWNNSCKDFASDIRKTWKPVNIFEIALDGGLKTDTATLNFNGFDNGSDLYLFTKLGDSIFQIDQAQKYTVTLQKGTTTYQTLFVTDNAGFLKAFPLHFKMSNAYPNPFCPITKINYTLPYRWSSDGKINQSPYLVSIEIYDIMGRNLRNLIYRKMVPGNYTVMWDGKMTNGRIAASGKYYCVLKADNLKHVRNMTLIK